MSIVATASEDENTNEHPSSEHGSRGGDFGNTHLANRQGGLETGGEDTAEIGVGIYWPVGGEKDSKKFFDALELAKMRAQERKEPVRVAYSGKTLAVFPRGWSSGRGKGVHYHYRTEIEGITLSLAHQFGPMNQRANVRIEIGAVTLMQLRGLRGAWIHAVHLIESLGGVILWDKISRIDLCADLPRMHAGDIANLVRGGHAVTRIRRKRYYEDGDQWTGVGVAPGSPTHLRVYDKAREVYIDKPDQEKARLLEELRWGGKVPEAMRVEWQLRRVALADFGITSIEDYFALRSGLILNLMTRWFRLTSSPPDRTNNNTQRAETHPDWKTIKDHFLAWMEPATVPAERVGRRPFLWPARDANQALGFLLRVLAYEKSGELIDGTEIRDCLHALLEKILEETSHTELVKRYEAKALLVVVQVV